jgi:hypothetical protein
VSRTTTAAKICVVVLFSIGVGSSSRQAKFRWTTTSSRNWLDVLWRRRLYLQRSFHVPRRNEMDRARLEYVLTGKEGVSLFRKTN